MDVFFADDSTQKGARDGMGTVVAAGGLFVEESALRPLAQAIDSIATAAGIPPEEELKWSPKKGTWIYDNLHGNAREACYAKVLAAAAEHKARAIVICWDTGRTTLKGADAFARCVEFLFERMAVHLEKRNVSAIVIADRPGGGKDQEEQFLGEFLQHVQNGTEHVVPDRILLNVLTTPSHLVRHLQLADLVTGITTAMVCGQTKYANSLFPAIQELLITNHMDGIAGTGLKVFPNSIVNLYHWVLGEQFLHRGGGAVSYKLPQDDMLYAKDGMREK